MLWGTLLTAQEGTDQNLRATSVCKQKGGLQRKTRERSIPDSGRLSMAPQPAKLRTPDQAKEPPDHMDSRDRIEKQFEIHTDIQSMG